MRRLRTVISGMATRWAVDDETCSPLLPIAIFCVRGGRSSRHPCFFILLTAIHWSYDFYFGRNRHRLPRGRACRDGARRELPHRARQHRTEPTPPGAMQSEAGGAWTAEGRGGVRDSDTV